MASRVLPGMLDEDMAAPLHEAFQEKGIHLMLSSRIKSIEKSGGRAKRYRAGLRKRIGQFYGEKQGFQLS